MLSKTFKTRFATSFRTWAETHGLAVVLHSEVTKPNTCAATFQTNGLVTVKVWHVGADAAVEVTEPAGHMLEAYFTA